MKKLKLRILPLKIFLTIVAFFLSLGAKADPFHARANFVKFLRHFLPYKLEKSLPASYNEMNVVGFNHPSLGEVPRILAECLDRWSAKKIYCPASLLYYDMLEYCMTYLNSVGVYLVPLITPHLRDQLVENGEDAEKVAEKQRHLQSEYTKIIKRCADDLDVIMIAPTARRQATVFASKPEANGHEKMTPVMTLLAMTLKNKRVNYIPMSVIPPNKHKGLNIGKTYQLIPGYNLSQTMLDYVSAKDRHKLRDFEYDFRSRIADNVPPSMYFPQQEISRSF